MKYSLYHKQAGGWVSCVPPEESEVEEEEEASWEVEYYNLKTNCLILSYLRRWSPAWKKHGTALPPGGLRWVDLGNNFEKLGSEGLKL